MKPCPFCYPDLPEDAYGVCYQRGKMVLNPKTGTEEEGIDSRHLGDPINHNDFSWRGSSSNYSLVIVTLQRI